MALTALTLLGAGYLLWIGINMLRHPPTPSAGDAQASGSWLRWAGKGICVSGLNPKVFLLFLALLPQLVDPQPNSRAWLVASDQLRGGLFDRGVWLAVGTADAPAGCTGCQPFFRRGHGVDRRRAACRAGDKVMSQAVASLKSPPMRA